jgi:hypothetical protein
MGIFVDTGEELVVILVVFTTAATAAGFDDRHGDGL